jgi:hypothetical protein
VTRRGAIAGVAAAVACGSALAAPHLEPCRRTPGYEDAVERIMRAAWPQALDLLTIMYVPLTERGIGLVRTADGFDLVRLELDESFWYSSWRDVPPGGDTTNAVAVATDVFRADGGPLGAQVLDFSKTRVRVAKSSVPISEELGVALLDALDRRAAAARVPDPTDQIVLDGYSFELLLSNRPCVELSNPPAESDAFAIAQLIRLLDTRVPAWRPFERQAFEADVLAAIPD